MYVNRLFFILTLLLGQTVSAVRMDETTHDMIIQRLEMGLDGMDKSEPERTGILLRLADLLADRGRLKYMNEIETNCKTCKGALADRQKAVALYQEALPKVDTKDQGRRVLQIAHLYGLMEQNTKAKQLYSKILTAKQGVYTSDVKAIAYTSVAEVKFRNGDFKGALKDFQAAKRENLRTRALVEFRIAWCQLNLGETSKAINSLVNLLKSPTLLQTQTTDGKSIDPTFINDLSRDLAAFLARGKTVGKKQIQLLRDLSPDAVRKDNLKLLAIETDRVGKKSASLMVWSAYVEEGDVQAGEKLEVQTRVAQIYYDINMQDVAASSYIKALEFWTKLGCKEPAPCNELKAQLRRFVTAWNKAQKKNPTQNLLRIYQAYVKTFPNDTEILHWGGIVAKNLKKNREAIALFHLAAASAAADLKATPNSKASQNMLEGSLLAEIELAEELKDRKAREVAYNYYIQMNPEGSRIIEVRYQRAQLYYELSRWQDAFSEFHYLATLPVVGAQKRDIRVKSADLALDSLVALKDDPNLQVRSLEYARIYPERKTEYLKISRKATMNLVAFNLKNEKSNSRTDYKASLAALSAVNMEGADDQERIKFFKNKIVIAQKAMDLNSVSDSATKLLAIKTITADDVEWTRAQQVWVAELQLNFALAYRLSGRMQHKDLSPADRELRLALLAELAGLNPRKHHEAYIRQAKSVRAANLVRVSLIRNSSNPWRELDRHLSPLNKTPDLLAGITLEVFVNKPHEAKVAKLLKTTSIRRHSAGQTLQRHLDLKDYHAFDKRIRTHRIYGQSDYTMQKTLKARIKLLNESERRAQTAFRRGDWTLKVLGLAQLSRENRRLYQDILSLPVPRRLGAKDRIKYQGLLKSQSQPYLTRAEKIDSELSAMWRESNSVQNLQSAYMTASPELQRLYRNEISPLAASAPPGVKNRLQNLLNTPFRRPSQKDILLARQELQANPFDINKAERLRELESQNGRAAMVAYLDERISVMKKGQSL